MTRARGQKQRGGVHSSHYVLHIPHPTRVTFGPFRDKSYPLTYCGRRKSDVNCTPTSAPSVSKTIGDSTGYTYARDEICKACLRHFFV